MKLIKWHYITLYAYYSGYHLPNYNVFDEVRNFSSADLPEPIDFKNKKLGIMICEDMWYDDLPDKMVQ